MSQSTSDEWCVCGHRRRDHSFKNGRIYCPSTFRIFKSSKYFNKYLTWRDKEPREDKFR